MQEKTWTIKEFAKKIKRSPAYVRQMCHGYLNHGYRMKLPEGFHYDKRRRLVFQKQSLALNAEPLSGREDVLALQQNARFDQLLEGFLNLHPHPIEWLEKQLKQRHLDERPPSKIEDKEYFDNMLENAFWRAASSGSDIQIALDVKKRGSWDVTVLKTSDPLAFTEITRTPWMVIERLYFSAWYDEILAVQKDERRSAGSPPDPFSESDGAWMFFRRHCLNCGEKISANRSGRRSKRIYCDPNCDDAHRDWVRRQADKRITPPDIFKAVGQRMRGFAKIALLSAGYEALEN